MTFSGLWMVFWIRTGLFLRIGYRSLLIQRCKKYARFGNFFVEGADLPDERRFCPTKEFWSDEWGADELGEGVIYEEKDLAIWILF